MGLSVDGGAGVSGGTGAHSPGRLCCAPHSPFRQRKARGLEQEEAGGGGDLRACSPFPGVSVVSQP